MSGGEDNHYCFLHQSHECNVYDGAYPLMYCMDGEAYFWVPGKKPDRLKAGGAA